MKRCVLICCGLILGVFLFFSYSWAVCPQDTVDSGICDTMYVEIYPPDIHPSGPPPIFARFPIYVTHDVQNPSIDSIAGFLIPLCYTHSNQADFCSLSRYWNNTTFDPPALARSIFRDLDGIQNWMLDLYEQSPFKVWDNIVLNLDGTSYFRLMMVPAGMGDQLFGDGSRVLLATMTFKMQDTMEICLDSCFWPPSARLAFARMDAQTYIPRNFLPKCQSIHHYGYPPFFVYCPANESQHTNGIGFRTQDFSVLSSGEYIVESVTANFSGSGVANVSVVFTQPPPGFLVEGYITYDVTNHCQGGGIIKLVAVDNYGNPDTCYIGITLSNSPPNLNLPDTVFALANAMTVSQVWGDDNDGDSVGIVMNAFWNKLDSLQPPVNPPSYNGGNPGLFTWMPAVADTGTWIASFLATDVCSAVDTDQVTILVGIPFCGDCTKDSLINLSDLVYLITYLYRGGVPPDPVCRADGNCDGTVNIGDVVALISYLYRGGLPPCTGCCAGGF
jgi:hypothetical protein